MNRILSILAIGYFLFSAPRASAQLINYHFTADNAYVTSNVPLNEISARAFRHFVKNFGDVPTAVWRKEAKGYTVRWYTSDSIGYIVHYSPHGMFFDTHIYYTALNAPADVRAEMGHLYPQYTLLFVNELAEVDHPLYEVGLAHEGRMLIVDLKDKAIEAEQYFARSK